MATTTTKPETFYAIGDMAYGRGSSPAEAAENFAKVLKRDFRLPIVEARKMAPTQVWRAPADADGFYTGYFMDGGCPVMWTTGSGDDRRNVRRATVDDLVPVTD